MESFFESFFESEEIEHLRVKAEQKRKVAEMDRLQKSSNELGFTDQTFRVARGSTGGFIGELVSIHVDLARSTETQSHWVALSPAAWFYPVTLF